MRNVEMYTLNYLSRYWDVYKNYLKDNDYKDIDYPGYTLKFN